MSNTNPPYGYDEKANGNPSSDHLPQQPYVPRSQPSHSSSFNQPAPPPAAPPPPHARQQSWGPNATWPPPGGPGVNPQWTGNTNQFGMNSPGGPQSPGGTYHPGMYQQNSFGPGMQQPQFTGQPQMMMQQHPPPAQYITPDMQCQQQGHVITSRFGVIGILSAFFLFPCGIIVCMMDQTEQCERCRQIFKRGLMD